MSLTSVISESSSTPVTRFLNTAASEDPLLVVTSKFSKRKTSTIYINSKMECSDMKGALKMSKSRDQTNGIPVFVINYRTFSLTKVNILCIQEIIQTALLKNILQWSSYWSAFFLIIMQFYVTVLIIKPTRCTNLSNLFLEWNSTCFRQYHCLKHVEFHSKNKFEKLVHLVGFIIRIYYDARSSECKIIYQCLYPMCITM